MRLQRIIVLVLAVFGAGLVGFLAYFFTLEEPEPEQPQAVTTVVDPETGEVREVPVQEEPPPPPSTDILTVTRDIAIGEPIQPSDLAWKSWLDSELREDYITRPDRPEAIREISGDLATGAIFAGTPLTSDSLLDISVSSVFAALITPGMRAITIPVNAISSVGGLVEHNDRVDVILTRTAAAGANRNFSVEPVSEILITNARVLAVDQSYGRELLEQGGIPTTVTLELSLKAALLLEAMRGEGAFSLALRPGATAEPTGAAPQRDFVRIVRDGVAENVTVRKSAQ